MDEQRWKVWEESPGCLRPAFPLASQRSFSETFEVVRASAVEAALSQARERALDEVREKLLPLYERLIGTRGSNSLAWMQGENHAVSKQFRSLLDSISENKPQDQDRGGL